MRKHTLTLMLAGGLVMDVMVGALVLLATQASAIVSSPRPAWHEVHWPFPMDQWGTGKAFRCDASACGAPLTIYLRAKVGFCNCTSGPSTDSDLDRLSDADLFGGALYPQASGQPIKAGWMTGRSRPFAIRDRDQRDATLITIGLHDGCDALVATAVLPRGAIGVAAPVVQQFLDSRTFAEWAQTMLGL